MRVLICASAAPLPPIDGFKLLVDQLVRGLKEAHEVRVVALTPHDGHVATEDPDLRLVPYQRRGRMQTVLRAPGPTLRSRPVSDDVRVATLWPNVRDELRRFQPDVVHVTSGRLAALAPHLAGWPSVLGAVDARHLNIEARARAASGLLRLALNEQARRVRRLIASNYHHFGHVTVVTEEDRAALLAIDPHLQVTAIPNGVDLAYFRPDSTSQADAGRVVFTGTMDYAPNVAAAQVLATEVLPQLRARHPEAHLALVGRSPAPAVCAFDRLPGITVTGEVPDIRPWLVGSAVFAAPMVSGTGIKNKLLEAMACGVPCVATPLALQGLAVVDGRHLLAVQSPQEMAEAISRLLTEPALADRLGRQARRYVEDHHSWAGVARQHAAIYTRVITAASSRRVERSLTSGA